jgi:hypothetical protein
MKSDPRETLVGVRASLLRFAWTSLALWAASGMTLEAAHGFKLAAYLDDELTRTLLRLAHAHGVGLSMIVLLVAAHVARIGPRLAAHLRPALFFAAVALPGGFALGVLGHPEGDPGPGVLLAPPGGFALLYVLTRIAAASFRR